MRPTFPKADPLAAKVSDIASPSSRMLMITGPSTELSKLLDVLSKKLRDKSNDILYSTSTGFYCYMTRNENLAISRGVAETFAREVISGEVIVTSHAEKAAGLYNRISKHLRALHYESSNVPCAELDDLILYFKALQRTLALSLNKLDPFTKLKLTAEHSIDFAALDLRALNKRQIELINLLHRNHKDTPAAPTPVSKQGWAYLTGAHYSPLKPVALFASKPVPEATSSSSMPDSDSAAILLPKFGVEGAIKQANDHGLELTFKSPKPKLHGGLLSPTGLFQPRAVILNRARASSIVSEAEALSAAAAGAGHTEAGEAMSVSGVKRKAIFMSNSENNAADESPASPSAHSKARFS